VSTCHEFGESLNSKNILYFSALGSQLFYYEEEVMIDNAVMNKIKKYEHLLGGPIMYRKFLKKHRYPDFNMIRDINNTLNLSRYALEQKIRIFLFSKPNTPLTCRLSICTQIDQFKYVIFYIEMSKSKSNQRNSHVKFNGLILFIVFAVCVHFKILK
jgi:hypothetical protein